MRLDAGRGAVIGALLLGASVARGAPLAPKREYRTLFTRTLAATSFIRGNLHVHTKLSDGDARPETVVAWYRDHGYGFLALTDHNRLSDPTAYEALSTPTFVVLSGEEVTMSAEGHQVHVNALCTGGRIDGGDFPTNRAALRSAISQINAQGGVGIVNHPNFDWALGREDLPSMRGAELLEIASGHPYVHGGGDGSHPSHEQLWDDALTEGADVMGVGVDDAHHLMMSDEPPAFPGKAWIEVFGDTVDADTICAALRDGALYASTGASLRAIRVSGDTYSVEPSAPAARVTFVGAGGRVLQRTKTRGGAAEYRLRGDEKYVRARVELEGGERAWAPAVPTYVE